MKLHFYGAARGVTGSCYLLDTGQYKVLIDCGAFQGSYELVNKNREDFPFDPKEIDYVILTHAHYDHCGRIPKLVREGFKGEIISTQPTRDLAQVVLMDSAHLQAEDYKRWVTHVKKTERFRNDDQNHDNNTSEETEFSPPEPYFSVEDVEKMMTLFSVYPFGNSVTLKDGLEVRMRDAGHILGSASIEIWAKNQAGITRKIVFSGDLGQPGQRIIKDPDMIRESDYIVVESTYGNRIHKSKDDTVLELLTILKKAQSEGGNVLIPTFAIERTQEVLYELNLFYENKLMSDMDVVLDSPMAKQATEIFQKYPMFYDEDAKRLLEKGDNPFQFEGFSTTRSVEDSKRLVGRKGVVIMAGSGMCTGGRIIHHLANNVEKKNTHIVFVGYQVHGTLGRKIVDGEPRLYIRDRKYDIKAKVHTLGGFSAHADMRDLKYWIRGFGHSPRMVFVTHGEEEIAKGFAQSISEDLKVDTSVPSLGDVVNLE